MPAEMVVGFSLSAAQKKELADGALSEDVYVQFICQTGPGEHDPEAEPDEHVRPSHAAYHGRIFKLADAPVPPLDYGCRCGIKYVAAPDTIAEKVLDDVAEEQPTTPVVATEDWLKENVPQYDAIKRAAVRATTKLAIEAAYQKAKSFKISDARAIAEMVVDIVAAEDA